jgi:hypothetical protein
VFSESVIPSGQTHDVGVAGAAGKGSNPGLQIKLQGLEAPLHVCGTYELSGYVQVRLLGASLICIVEMSVFRQSGELGCENVQRI